MSSQWGAPFPPPTDQEETAMIIGFFIVVLVVLGLTFGAGVLVGKFLL